MNSQEFHDQIDIRQFCGSCKKVSKYLSNALRHRPGEIGLVPTVDGWLVVNELLDAFAKHGTQLTREQLEYVVEHNDKGRYTLNGDRIRANYGHSIEVDLGLTPAVSPTQLFHGTAKRNLDSIFRLGLIRGNRQYVHLSADRTAARRVGARHGIPVVLTVDAESMALGGHSFYRPSSSVWLTNHVPPKYLALA